MDTRNAFLKVQNVVQSVPLESLLSTAKTVAQVTNIPFLPLIITLLERLIKWRPVANALLGTGLQTADAISAAMSQPVDMSMSNEASQAVAEEDEIRAILDQMIDIAAEDGDLSDEEKQYLIEIAREAGVNEQVVLAKVRMKCMSNK